MKTYCESINAQLYIINSIDENYLLVRAFPAAATFLGAHKEAGEWKWNDGKKRHFFNWAKGDAEKAEDVNCIQFVNGGRLDGKWFETSCQYRFYTVCKLNNCDSFVEKEKEENNLDIKNYVDTSLKDESNSLFAKMLLAIDTKMKSFAKNERDEQKSQTKEYLNSITKGLQDSLFQQLVSIMESRLNERVNEIVKSLNSSSSTKSRKARF
ncbi:hypothetical protein B4U80_12148 [Leptotrombidium deliense]|uniref:C-type lectin domain-containing protein n=1 Tax=Leptotrombidium deliense TaxID=299467 RepID=A0A443RY44_9ACAR|nr:hypothetical protein B4U80_12148 [Leptotrombidium deliense]